MNKDVKEAREHLANTANSFINALTGASTVETDGIEFIMEDGKQILPTHTIGWDFKSIPGLKMQVFSEDVSEKDVFFCIAQENTVIRKHKHLEAAIVYMIHGTAKDMVAEKVINERQNYKIPSMHEYELSFKKGAIFVITFIPKIKKQKKN